MVQKGAPMLAPSHIRDFFLKILSPMPEYTKVHQHIEGSSLVLIKSDQILIPIVLMVSNAHELLYRILLRYSTASLEYA